MARSPLIVLGAGALALATPARSEAGTYTFTPVADAQVMSKFPKRNFGASSRLTVDASPAIQSHLRFLVSSLVGSITSARLRLYVQNGSTDGPQLFRTTAAWDERTITWNTRPAATSAALGDLGVVQAGTWVELPVTAVVTATGSYQFMLSGGGADASVIASRETTQRPQLVIVTDSVAEPTSTPPTAEPTPTEPTPTEPTPTEPTPTEPTPTEPTPTEPTPSPTATTVEVTLQPRSGITGTQRVNFAVPLPRGLLLDPDQVRIVSGGVELPAARRELALHPDGSVRSVQLQVETTVSAGKVLQVRLNEAPTTAALTLAAVSTTLEPSDGSMGPRVWALLPAAWLAASGVTGPQVTEASVEGTALDAFDRVCDYPNHTVSQFLSLQTAKDVWLYDRGTTMYRAYARRGDLLTLESAYRETAIYRNGLTGTDASTRIGVPDASADLKYHYTQNLAIHYLLTGDDRFRESAEDVATRVYGLWGDPGYAGGSDFWTERHAGFALLAYVWARIVTDNEGAILESRANAAVDAYVAVQNTYPTTWTDPAARCFAHTATAHGEPYGTWGCSPWMSAILADGLDQYATEMGGAFATKARTAIVKLGTILARDGRDSTGKPYYWMGVGSQGDEVDPYHEHWGEPAYVVAMAWHLGGRTDAALKTAATQMLAGLKSYGSSPHMRSFNWQCRSAIAAPYYLK